MEFHRAKAETVIVQPGEVHKQTFIILHGRGDTASAFGPDLISTSMPDGSTLRSLYPNAKFVFLQAPLCAVAAAPGDKWYQWFDVWSLLPGSEETDLQIPGLRAVVQLVHGTLQQEIDLVGAENVILGGLSQGCASSLISLLLWDGQPIAACFGMSGWLPFRKVLEDAVLQTPVNQNTESLGSGKSSNPSPGSAAVTALAKKLNYASSYIAPLVFQKVPIFMGHGNEDHVIYPRLGQEAALCISGMGSKVTWKVYRDLTHWYSPDMLHDIVEFLHKETQLT